MPAEPIAAVADQFAPISLEEANGRAALQTRVDCKYILPWPRFEAFATQLRVTHAVLAIDGRRVFGYDTLYFDTASLLTYRAHLQGRRKRFKARSRLYVDSGLCLFEVKLKGR
ncbi:MAG: VTC domain-containing protein [Chloroflexota bacterium]